MIRQCLRSVKLGMHAFPRLRPKYTALPSWATPPRPTGSHTFLSGKRDEFCLSSEKSADRRETHGTA